LNLSNLNKLLPGVSVPSKVYYRLVDARYALEIDEIVHTVLYSWRYNPKGEFGVLYLSISSECAYREKLKQIHGRKQDLSPQVVGVFKVNLTKCLDLTNSSFRETLNVSLDELINRYDFSLTQSIAREARKLGFEAIIAPSAVGENCSSLVVFKDKLVPPSYCIYERELERGKVPNL
jgi:RES domain-containing protein